MKIFQITEALTIGDAVSNDVIQIDLYLKKKQLCGGIFVCNEQNISSKYLHNIAERISDLPQICEDDIILFHHSIANNFCYKLRHIDCYKVLVYHNITPPFYFNGYSEGLAEATKRGLDQLVEISDVFDSCIADSEFNKKDLIKAGYKCPIYVCPVLVPFDDYKQLPNQKIINKYKDDYVNILFVGRVCPHKKIEDVIHIFALYKKYYNNKSRLFVVGNNGIDKYSDKLLEYIKNINVKDVHITGSVPFADILGYYNVADIFLCMSEHEGFCVPLVEAMFFGIPIVTLNKSAIIYTMGSSGVVLSNQDYLLASGWINIIQKDQQLRDSIIKGQNDRLSFFSYSNVIAIFESIIEKFILDVKKMKYNDPVDNILLSSEYVNTDYIKKDFDIVMPIKESDWETAKRTIPYLRKFLHPKKIVIISSSNLVKNLNGNHKDIIFVDENHLIRELSFNEVKNVIKDTKIECKFTGWYFQQFLKLGYSKICSEDYYLVWDADTLPINDIYFFNNKMQPLWNLKREYVKAYFKTLQKLLNLKKSIAESFITEHMLINTNICKKMLNDIEKNNNIPGNLFWEKILYSCDTSLVYQSFSEFETYGTYCYNYYKDLYGIRQLRTLRCAKEFVPYEYLNKDIINWISKDFDTISFESWGETFTESQFLIKFKIVRKVFRFKEYVQFICWLQKIKAAILGSTHKQKYNNLKSKQNFDYFFGDKTAYEVNFYKRE